MPAELAAPLALLSLGPLGGKVAMPALFKAGLASGVAGKTAGASSFAGLKGGIGGGAGKSFAAKHTAGTDAAVSSKEASEKVESGFAILSLMGMGKTASDTLMEEREKAEKPRRVVLSRRGDRSRKYGEFL